MCSIIVAFLLLVCVLVLCLWFAVCMLCLMLCDAAVALLGLLMHLLLFSNTRV